MKNKKRDIRDKADIKNLVEAFYRDARSDKLIGLFFNQIVKLDFEIHIPIIIEFWNSVLFGTGEYRGNPILKHIALHNERKLSEDHFDRWIEIWTKQIRNNYEGQKAEEAIHKAETMKVLMLHKIKQSESGFHIL